MHHHATSAPHTHGHVIHWARWYDRLGRLLPFARALRERLLELAGALPGARVLDVGCGTGELAIALSTKTQAAEVHGIDASPEMIEVAQKKVGRSGVAARFQVALVEALPFPDASMDLVTSSLMLHHLPAELKPRALAEVRRVLRPGGRFLAVDFAARSHSRLGHLLALVGHKHGHGHGHGEGTVAEVVPLLKAAGFGDVAPLASPRPSFAFLEAR